MAESSVAKTTDINIIGIRQELFPFMEDCAFSVQLGSSHGKESHSFGNEFGKVLSNSGCASGFVQRRHV